MEKDKKTLLDLINAVTEAMVLTDRKGEVIFANKKARKLLDFKKTKKVRLDIFKITPCYRLRAGLMNKIKQTVKAREPKQLVSQDKKNGVLFLKLYPILDRKKQVKQIVIFIKNITREATMRRELKKSKEKYRILIETVPHGIEECDLSGTITFCNKAYTRIMGGGKDNYTGEKIWNRVAGGVAEKRKLKKYFENLVKNQPAPKPYFKRNIKRGGGFIDLRVDWNYERSDKGELIGFVQIVTDITEEKKARKYLRKSRERFRRIVETVPGFITIVNERGKTIYASPKCKEVLGFTQEEMKNKARWWIHKDDRGKIKRLLRRTYEQGQPGLKDVEYKAVRKNGRIWYASSSWEPLFSQKNKVLGMVLQTRDITEKKKIEKRLIESYKQLGLINRRVSVLIDINKSKPQEILKFVTRAALEFSDAKICELYYFDKKQKKLFQISNYIKPGFSVIRGAGSFCIWPAGLGHIRQFIKEKKRIQGLAEDYNIRKFCPDKKIKAFLLLPIVVKKRLAGCLFVGFSVVEKLSTQELNFYDVFSAHLATVIGSYLKKNESE
ncbi:MAG: PAS domain S-box protein [Patescibacteria group bacterium]|nr:PAS domain S-box protein [Patescibacteria group bacterium]